MCRKIACFNKKDNKTNSNPRTSGWGGGGGGGGGLPGALSWDGALDPIFGTHDRCAECAMVSSLPRSVRLEKDWRISSLGDA